MNSTVLLFLLGSLFAIEVSAQSNEIDRLQSKIDSLEYVILRQNVMFKGLVQLSSSDYRNLDVDWKTLGDYDIYGFNYRIEIYLSEIYRSLYITKIGYWGEGVQRIEYTFEVDIESLLGINSEETSSLKFLRWISQNEFEIKTTKGTVILEILDTQKVQIKA